MLVPPLMVATPSHSSAVFAGQQVDTLQVKSAGQAPSSEQGKPPPPRSGLKQPLQRRTRSRPGTRILPASSRPEAEAVKHGLPADDDLAVAEAGGRRWGGWRRPQGERPAATATAELQPAVRGVIGPLAAAAARVPAAAA